MVDEKPENIKKLEALPGKVDFGLEGQNEQSEESVEVKAPN